jgi:hypothetical protein
MKRKGVIYLLLLLVVWGWVDDLAVSTANDNPADDTFTSDNDEYLSSVQLVSTHKERRDCAAAPQTALSFLIDPALCQPNPQGFTASQHPTFAAADPLYAFMSLQC